MLYNEAPPPPSLAPWVRCIWVFETTAQDPPQALQRVVPDGHPELVLDYGDVFHEVTHAATSAQPRVLIAGQMAQPLLLQPGRRAGVMGIRFHPAALRSLLGLPMHECAIGAWMHKTSGAEQAKPCWTRCSTRPTWQHAWRG